MEGAAAALWRHENPTSPGRRARPRAEHLPHPRRVRAGRKVGARDLELEEAVCYFNNAEFAIGTYVQSGDEVLKCTGRGVWERRGENRPG
jgi:hypothetical protein